MALKVFVHSEFVNTERSLSLPLRVGCDSFVWNHVEDVVDAASAVAHFRCVVSRKHLKRGHLQAIVRDEWSLPVNARCPRLLPPTFTYFVVL